MTKKQKIAVVLPCYRVRAQILDVVGKIGAEAELIIVVDDACPEQSGRLVEQDCKDPRIRVIRHERNTGVGGAVVSGYKAAAKLGATVIVKIDGDGQMDPALLLKFVRPIALGRADYVKGNRFTRVSDVRAMPWIRIFGNGVLSFLTKLSSGYWSLFDPTNGYTAIHASLLPEIDLDRLSQRFFFESDMLFRLNIARARVVDMPMTAVYGDENSSLSVTWASFHFLWRHIVNFIKRIVYNYFLRGFSAASLQLILGILAFGFGVIYGVIEWVRLGETDNLASAGTVMLAALPTLIGISFLLAFVSYDVAAEPRESIHPLLDPND